MDLKKEATIKAYSKAFGNVTDACKAVKISRKTFYEWLKTDQEFKEAIETAEPEEVFVDFAENALIRRIKANDTTAIIFALKSKGKHRGYVERQEVTGKDGQQIGGFNYITPPTNGNHKANGKADPEAARSLAETNGQGN